MVETNLPILFLKKFVILPYNELRLEFQNKKDIEILKNSESNHDNYLLLINLSDPLEEDPGIESLPNMGVLGKIKSLITLPNGIVRAVIAGIDRVMVLNYLYNDKDMIESFVTAFKEYDGNILEEDALKNILFKQLEEYIDNCSFVSNDILGNVQKMVSISKISDMVISELPFSYEEKVKYVNVLNPHDRIKMLIEDIGKKIEAQKLENEIEVSLKNKLDVEQKEYILREKIKLIKEELGENSLKDNEINTLKNKVDKLDAPLYIKKRLDREINSYEMMSQYSPEVGMIRNYIDWLINLPWFVSSKESYDIARIERNLNESHYGLEEVKSSIIEYAALLKHNSKVNNPIICLVGPSGVGKTSIAKEIAHSLGRKFVKVSVGGVNDEAMIKGHRRTYISSSPGKIIEGLRKVKVNNPVFLIDEIDKLTNDYKGDPASSLLDVLDPTQNKNFVDNYIEEEVDLSKVLFILTANYEDKIPEALRDRLEIIHISSYTLYDKINIAKSYLIPRLLKEYNLTNIHFTDNAIRDIILYYTRESGVRELERIIGKVLRRTMVLEKNNIILSDVKEYLGSYKYEQVVNDVNDVGVVNALGFAPNYGTIIKVSSSMFKGSGKLILTGCIKDNLKESAEVAFSYIKSNYKKFNIDYEDLLINDFHIHFEGSNMYKDGPSAGISIVTSLISLLTLRGVDNSIAMTGEITLRGKILPVGKIKEKIITAEVNNVKTLFIPKDNIREFNKLEADIKKNIDIILVNSYDDVVTYIFK